MAKIGIMGSGNVGANAAFFLAEKQVADVLLYDVKEGLSTGKALDMMEAAPVRGYLTKISGTDVFEDILATDLLIITAGAVRKPGMKREALCKENRSIIAGAASSLRDYDGIIVIVTEPVDLLTTLFAIESGLPANRVLGLGGFLDSTRLRYLIAKELSVSTESVDAVVIGRHADSMIPLPAYCRVSGIPAGDLIDEARLEEIFEETKRAGGTIVDMAQRASAYYGPSAAVSDLAETILRDTRRIISVSHMLEGQYGISNVAMSLPSIVGPNGVEKTLEPVLTDSQRAILKESADIISTGIAQGRGE